MMRKTRWMSLALLLVVPGFLLTVSCAKKTVKSQPAVTQAAEEEAARQAQLEAEKARQEALAKKQEEARRRAIEEQRLADERAKAETQRRIREAREQFVNDDIYFPYDKSTLLPEAQDVLKRKAQWMRMNPDASVVIEGHCDERGTNEYNLALGDRRAESAKKFLVYLGIESSRLTTISYGEERPVDPGQTESAWAKNRRAHFSIQ